MPTLALVICTILVIVLYPIARAAMSLAPWVPTKIHDVGRLLSFLNLTAADTFVELGSGTATVTRAVAARFPTTPCIGVERAWPIHLVARHLAKNLPNCTLINGDLFNYNLKDATVIYIFGMPGALRGAVTTKILKECKSGTRIISYTFRMHALPLHHHYKNPDTLSLYEYILP
jgi:precorrin-6B methylase 2